MRKTLLKYVYQMTPVRCEYSLDIDHFPSSKKIIICRKNNKIILSSRFCDTYGNLNKTIKTITASLYSDVMDEEPIVKNKKQNKSVTAIKHFWYMTLNTLQSVPRYDSTWTGHGYTAVHYTMYRMTMIGCSLPEESFLRITVLLIYLHLHINCFKIEY